MVKIIPRAPVTMLKHEIVLLVNYKPPTLKGGGGEEYRFAKRFNLANPNSCVSQPFLKNLKFKN